MANAEKISEMVAVHKVRLTLTLKEAEALHAVMRRISGTTTNSPRKHTDSISKALKDAGVAYGAPGDQTMFTGLVFADRHVAELLGGSGLIFKDYPINWTEAERG